MELIRKQGFIWMPHAKSNTIRFFFKSELIEKGNKESLYKHLICSLWKNEMIENSSTTQKRAT